MAFSLPRIVKSKRRADKKKQHETKRHTLDIIAAASNRRNSCINEYKIDDKTALNAMIWLVNEYSLGDMNAHAF